MYIHEPIPARRRTDLANNHLELVAEITQQRKTFIVGTCYRPPDMSAAQVNTFIADTQSVINKIITENPEAFFLLE